MTYVLRQCILCAGRALVFTPCRGFVATPACLVRGRVQSSKQLSNSRVEEKLLKDSDFVDIEEDFEDLSEPDLNISKLTREYESEIKKEKRKLWKLLIKRKMGNVPKSPNMLTSSEREHMKYLHNSDPEQWTPETLSESFPALPHVIKKILKNKWSKETVEAIKIADAQVLENWDKLKRNELKAPPAVLKHLKKFVNRRDTLKAQLESPKFFPEPPVPKKIAWSEGPFKKLITQYEREIEKIKKMKEESKMVTAGSGDGLALQNENRISLSNEIKMEAEAKEIKDDSFIIGKINSHDKMMTLDNLKQSILEKTEKKKQLSRFEKLVLNKTLQGGGPNEEKVRVQKKSDKLLSSQSDETNVKVDQKALLDRIVRDAAKEENSKMPTHEKKMTRRIPKPTTESEICPNLREDETRVLSVTEVGQFLHPTEIEEEVRVEERKPEPKPRVNYYGTVKDKEMVERDVELLSNTSFWGSTNKPRNKSKDAAIMSTRNNPHMLPSLKTYFTYDYPERIEIPEKKWKKGMIYRVKDCYYDDDGVFLYRVPGMEME